MAWPNDQGSPILVEPVTPNRTARPRAAIPGRHMDRARPPTLVLGIEVPAWQDQANCRGRDDLDALFFPPKGPVVKQIRDMCAACPVQAECLEYAIETNSQGVWAGTNDQMRKRIRSGMSRPRFCNSGHDLNFHGYIGPDQRRRCRACAALRARERNQKEAG